MGKLKVRVEMCSRFANLDPRSASILSGVALGI